MFAEMNAVIGFMDSPYSTNESVGVLTVQVGVISGSLQTDIVLHLSTMDVTAIGELSQHNVITLCFWLIQCHDTSNTDDFDHTKTCSSLPVWMHVIHKQTVCTYNTDFDDYWYHTHATFTHVSWKWLWSSSLSTSHVFSFGNCHQSQFDNHWW